MCKLKQEVSEDRKCGLKPIENLREAGAGDAELKTVKTMTSIVGKVKCEWDASRRYAGVGSDRKRHILRSYDERVHELVIFSELDMIPEERTL